MTVADHIAGLERQNSRLKRQIRWMQLRCEKHNTEQYATGLIVRCTGCEAGKPLDGENLTEERVAEVERIARRLREWYTNHKGRTEQ